MREDRITSHPILEAPVGEKMVEFAFNGKAVQGRPGEMISSALFACGIQVFGHHHKDGSPQGIFCANGQCAQCLVIADGLPVKSCITPVSQGLDVRSLEGLPGLKADDNPLHLKTEITAAETDALIIGGGPAGLTAAIELANAGLQCIICDDKNVLGGKLSLQTHNFFGSVSECYAGDRGMDIGKMLEKQVRELPGVAVWIDSPAVAVFADGTVGLVRAGKFALVKPKQLLVATGAREKTLVFPGADLPGVYGAGAFQTLVNRDLVKPCSKLFIVGGGNVGLIAAYHALQAGIDVVGLVEALPVCGGYKVHRDKILRLGIPVYTSHSILRAEGNERVERVVVTKVDGKFQPVPGTEMEYDVDTVLIAVGLSPVDELLHEARKIGMNVYAAGDAQEIAEASAAMFSGKITARQMLRDAGKSVDIPKEWSAMLSTLRAKPGNAKGYATPPADLKIFPVLRCEQEIPCNPCTDACAKGFIKTTDGGILGLPGFSGDCKGCMKCVAICPGLAVTLVDRNHDPSGKTAKVTIPWEMPDGLVAEGQSLKTTGAEGEILGSATVLKITAGKWLNKRKLLALQVPMEQAHLVAGVQVREPVHGRPLQGAARKDSDPVVCRCERVTREEILSYIQRTGTTDFNAVKAALRCGMGPCGGKTCSELIARIFREAGIKPADVEPHVRRPFTQEVPMAAFLKEGSQ